MKINSITKKIMNTKRKVTVDKFNAQLKECNAQMILLKAKAGAKIEYFNSIEKLQHKHNKASQSKDDQ